MPAELAPSAAVRIAILAFPGVDDLDLMGAYSVLSKASALALDSDPASTVEVRIAAGTEHLHTSSGLPVARQAGLDYAAVADAIVIPGGRGIADQLTAPDYLDCLQEAHRNAVALYCVCSGVLLAAAAGLVDGHALAIHAGKQAELGALADVRCDSGLVRDRRVTTVGGDRASSVKSIDLCLQLLADLAPQLIEPLAMRMELVQGRVLHTAGKVARS